MRRFLRTAASKGGCRGYPPPNSVPGLIVWSTADALGLSNGMSVASLVDISGNAVPMPIHPSSVGQPTVVSPSANGHSGILFGNQQGFLITDPAALVSLASVGFTSINVVRTPAAGTAHVWGGGNATDTFFQEAFMTSVFTQFTSDWSSTDFQSAISNQSPTNTLSVLTVRKRADRQEVRVNTVPGAIVGVTPFPTPIALAHFGVWCYSDPLFYDGSEPMTGYEFMAWDNYVSDSVIENVERGLMLKYGIA